MSFITFIYSVYYRKWVDILDYDGFWDQFFKLFSNYEDYLELILNHNPVPEFIFCNTGSTLLGNNNLLLSFLKNEYSVFFSVGFSFNQLKLQFQEHYDMYTPLLIECIHDKKKYQFLGINPTDFIGRYSNSITEKKAENFMKVSFSSIYKLTEKYTMSDEDILNLLANKFENTFLLNNCSKEFIENQLFVIKYIIREMSDAESYIAKRCGTNLTPVGIQIAKSNYNRIQKYRNNSQL